MVEAEALALPPVALFVAAVSPPDLYARAVMKLYLTRALRADEPAPLQEVLAKLRGWRELPRDTVMLARSPCPTALPASNFSCGNWGMCGQMGRSSSSAEQVP